MKPIAFIPLLCTFTILCINSYAAEEQDQPKLTVSFDHGKLTEWVLKDFPKGLPFDRAGTPTDLDAATKFWRLLADWPIQVVGEVTDVRAALEQISDETGLPILYGEDALAKIEAAEKKMRMVTISDSVEKAVKIISMQAGVEQTGITPLGLVILGPDEDPDTATLLTAPPKNAFRWRETEQAVLRKAFPNGVPEEMTSDDLVRKCTAILERRCDVIVPEPMDLIAFLNWLAKTAEVTIVIDSSDPFLDPSFVPPEDGEEPPDFAPTDEEAHPPDQASQEERVQDSSDSGSADPADSGDREPPAVGPMALRFVTLRQALDSGLGDFGLTIATDQPAIVVIPKEWQEELEKRRRQDVESAESDTGSSHQEEGSHD